MLLQIYMAKFINMCPSNKNRKWQSISPYLVHASFPYLPTPNSIADHWKNTISEYGNQRINDILFQIIHAKADTSLML